MPPPLTNSAALTLWYAAEQAVMGAEMGLAERTATITRTAWPFLVVLWCRGDVAAADSLGFSPDGREQLPG